MLVLPVPERAVKYVVAHARERDVSECSLRSEGLAEFIVDYLARPGHYFVAALDSGEPVALGG